MIRWNAQAGRIVARSGSVEIGAIFPPGDGGRVWRWRLWTNGKSWPSEGHFASEAGAKQGLGDAWAAFLARAGLEATRA